MKSFKVAFCLGCSLLLAACYHLGTPAQLSFRTLYVAPVANDTYVPQAQGLATTQLREALLLDPRITLVDPSDADATLTVTLTNYTQTTTASAEKETGIPHAFSYTLTASIDLWDARNQQYLLKGHTLSASITTYVDGGSQVATYQSIGPLTRDLATRIQNAVLSAW